MYAIICIGEDGKYVRATSKTFATPEAGREYKNTVAKGNEPIMVPEYLVDDAISINNKRLETEANKS